MKLFGKRILIESIAAKKKSSLILKENAKNQEDLFDITHKVIGVGPDCPKDEENKLNIGDIPVFGAYAQPFSVKIIEKNNDRTITHMVYYYDDIAGVEEDL